MLTHSRFVLILWSSVFCILLHKVRHHIIATACYKLKHTLLRDKLFSSLSSLYSVHLPGLHVTIENMSFLYMDLTGQLTGQTFFNEKNIVTELAETYFGGNLTLPNMFASKSSEISKLKRLTTRNVFTLSNKVHILRTEI